MQTARPTAGNHFYQAKAFAVPVTMEVANGPASGPASAEDPNTGLQGPLAPKASRAFMALGLDELEVPGDGSEHSGSQDDVEEYYDDDDSYYTEDEV